MRWETRRSCATAFIHTADGIDTRTLAHRTRMPLHLVTRLLDSLREERFIDIVAGAHFPGHLMELATTSDPDRTLLKDSLARLRDELGAAVYISTYTDGEITVQECAFSDAAPPVVEVAPFSDTGHASANGKSLLAQLDFTSRMDYLTRYPFVPLTGRTITSKRRLIAELDDPGPHCAQFSDASEVLDDVLARELFAARDAGAGEQQQTVILARALGHAYFREWGRRAHGLHVAFTDVEFADFSVG